MSIDNVEATGVKELNDGCAPAICPSHGVLARALADAAHVYCKTCLRWCKAESPREKTKRERTRERVRRLRSAQCNADGSPKNNNLQGGPSI
jgi:hypothetical protein